jgi:NADH-quinone oxidoreductase subunit M
MFYLTLLTFLPLATAVVIVLLARNDAVVSRYIALGGSLLTLLLVLYLVVTSHLDFSGTNGTHFMYEEHVPWLPQIGSSYHLGMDGLSLLLVLLTTILVPVAILMSNESITERVPLYMGLVLLLETSLLGVFLSLDLILFYVFWEGVLIPAYLLIGVYGGERRVYAALKYVLYTMIGSLLMLVGVVGVYVFSPLRSTFDIVSLSQPQALASPALQVPLLIFFGLAFAIKSALFPFHSWAPDVYGESATPTTMLLAGVVSKMGVYGFLRIALPLFPAATRQFAGVAATLAVIGIIYGALLALAQLDAKRLVACSSISHMCFILLGVFALNEQGVQGATLQMFNHGITTAALFAIIGAIAWRWGTTDLRRLEGLGQRARVLSVVFIVVALSSLGLPGLNSFAGEFLILLGAFRDAGVFGVAGTIGVILAAWYMLRLYQGIMQGAKIEPSERPTHGIALRANELAALLPLIVLIVWIGVAPAGWLHPASSAARYIVDAVSGAH